MMYLGISIRRGEINPDRMPIILDSREDVELVLEGDVANVPEFEERPDGSTVVNRDAFDENAGDRLLVFEVDPNTDTFPVSTWTRVNGVYGWKTLDGD